MTDSTRDPPQIQAPELLSAPERRRDTLVTALMWVVYLYLWVPLVSLFAWLLGFEFAYDVMIRSGGARGLDKVLITYGISITLILATVAVWSIGNRLRYGRLSRRRSASEVKLEPMAEYFGVDLATGARLRSLKMASISFDSDGRPLVERHEPSLPDGGPDSLQLRGSEAANSATSARHNQP